MVSIVLLALLIGRRMVTVRSMALVFCLFTTRIPQPYIYRPFNYLLPQPLGLFCFMTGKDRK